MSSSVFYNGNRRLLVSLFVLMLVVMGVVAPSQAYANKAPEQANVKAVYVCSDNKGFDKWRVSNHGSSVIKVNWFTKGMSGFEDSGFEILQPGKSNDVFSVKSEKRDDQVTLTIKDENYSKTLTTAVTDRKACGETEQRGKIQFSKPNTSAVEGDTIKIAVERVGGKKGTIEATMCFCSGSAKAGKDFVDTIFTVTFKDGETSKVYELPLVEDNQAEERENFIALLQGDNEVLGFRRSMVLFITDND
ncbi:Calx-beta domain-containing protein [Paenibacillus assamensis]|uniref:Calx-beta domain-containing protein n=1 Tax=Paenibacillus assamensis TaxID=311244 RepID=UPI000403CFE7|nr:Calx-beta domain-containing protein [Paenibacillus assamensis]